MGFWGVGNVRARAEVWRNGSAEGQWAVAALLVLGVSLSLVVSFVSRDWMPLSAYWLWLVAGMLLLRFGPLLVVAGYTLLGAVASIVLTNSVTGLRVVSLVEFAVAAAILLAVASRQRTGLPTSLSGAVLGELKDRLHYQSKIPALPAGWDAQSATVSAHNTHYTGAFMVSRRDEAAGTLEIILVDLYCAATSVGPVALHVAGALGGLIGALPPDRLFAAANDFLRRERDEGSYATAVHIRLDLNDGSYLITNAGHPPVLRWDRPMGEWVMDGARGAALGLLAVPDLHASEGRLFPGEGLLFYTDGVVGGSPSGPEVGVGSGVGWLQGIARDAMGGGFGGAARRIISHVDSGEDDRAVLILSRSMVTAPVLDAPTRTPVPDQAAPVSGDAAVSWPVRAQSPAERVQG